MEFIPFFPNIYEYLLSNIFSHSFIIKNGSGICRNFRIKTAEQLFKQRLRNCLRCSKRNMVATCYQIMKNEAILNFSKSRKKILH